MDDVLGNSGIVVKRTLVKQPDLGFLRQQFPGADQRPLGGNRGIDFGRKDVFLADLLQQAAVAQDADDIGAAAADQHVPAGPAQVVVKRFQRHHRGGVQVPRVLHAENEDADVFVLGLAADLVLEQSAAPKNSSPST